MSDGSNVPLDAIKQTTGDLPVDTINKVGPISSKDAAKTLDPIAAATLQEQWEKDKLDILPTKNSNDILKVEMDRFEASQRRTVIDRIRGWLAPKPKSETSTQSPTAVTSEASRTFGYRRDGSPKTTAPTLETPPITPNTPPSGTPGS